MRWNDLIGRRLGQYTILEEIGRGGSSRVYRGHDDETERDVAIKVIPNDAEDRVGFVHRFEREVQAVAQLNHPNIVTVFDRGENDDLVYLVMQCVMGGTLRTRLGKPLAAQESAAYIVQMAQALHHAHQRGIIHRDVKPSNMLIDAEDPRHLLLTDFGIAKLQGARGLTKTGTTIGTPEYMAPEQAEGKDIDARADVYSLGCVLYEALAGRPPFVGSSPVSVLYQQVHSRPPYIRGFNPDVPRELTRLLDTTLAKRPEDRFGTAELLALALAPFAEEGATGALGVSVFGQLGPRPESLTPSPQSSGPAQLPALEWPFTPGQPENADPSPLAPLAQTLGTPPAAEPGAQAAGEWRGLGAEGLDALFPEDGDAGSGASTRAPGPDAPPQHPQASDDRLHHTIPLPAFRLPARRTRPLNLPLTERGELDLERLMAQVDTPNRADGRGMLTRGEGGPPAGETWRQQYGGPDLGADMRAGQGQPQTPQSSSFREALLRTGEYRTVRPVWRPTLEDTPDTGATRRAARRSGSRRVDGRQGGSTRSGGAQSGGAQSGGAGGEGRRSEGRRSEGRRSGGGPRLWAGLGVAAVLLLLAATWVGVSASGLGLTMFGNKHPAARATATPTATVVPTATTTPTPSASATATTNPQALLDKQAAAAFRAVTLATFVDSSCSSGNNTTRFANGQAVYVNLCLANNAPSTSMNVQIRQKGTVFVALVQNLPIGPGGGSLYFYRYGLGPGTYDMLVTLQLNGHTATARDITFTVG
jgi:serine/threonine protein kinase